MWISKLDTDSEATVSSSTTSWCLSCLHLGIRVQLCPRLYNKEELIDGNLPHDSYDWLECRDCGRLAKIN